MISDSVPLTVILLFPQTMKNSETTWEYDNHGGQGQGEVSSEIIHQWMISGIVFQFLCYNYRITTTIRKEATRGWTQWWSLTPTRPPNSPLLSNSTGSIHSTTVTKDAPYSGHWIPSLPTTSPSPSTSHCLYLGQPITAYHCIIAPSHHCVQV